MVGPENIYLTEKELSERTGFAVQTLRNHRFNRCGLPYVKMGRSVRYYWPDVHEYLQSHRITPDD